MPLPGKEDVCRLAGFPQSRKTCVAAIPPSGLSDVAAFPQRRRSRMAAVAGIRQYRAVRNPSKTKRRGFRVAASASLRIARTLDPHQSHSTQCIAFKRFPCVDPGAPSAASASTMVTSCEHHPAFLRAARISLGPTARFRVGGIESDPSRISPERTTLSSIGVTSGSKKMLGDRGMNGAMVIERGLVGDPRREGPCCG